MEIGNEAHMKFLNQKYENHQNLTSIKIYVCFVYIKVYIHIQK